MKIWTSAGGESPSEIDYKHGAIHLQIDDDICTLDCDLTNEKEIREMAEECLLRHQLRLYRNFHRKLDTIINMKFKNGKDERTEI